MLVGLAWPTLATWLIGCSCAENAELDSQPLAGFCGVCLSQHIQRCLETTLVQLAMPRRGSDDDCRQIGEHLQIVELVATALRLNSVTLNIR